MKSILLSIKPKYVELIASGEKTIEVRKTAPQEVPFKCYIYETKGQYVKFTHGAHTKYGYGRGKVIGVPIVYAGLSGKPYVFVWLTDSVIELNEQCEKILKEQKK